MSPVKSLIKACQKAYEELLDADPDGAFNLILSNGFISLVFIHWRPFYLLHRVKSPGDALFISTLRLNEHEEWIKFNRLNNRRAKMLVVSGNSIIFNGNI